MRIKSRLEFSATFRSGIVVADATLVMHAKQDFTRPCRLGISIPKKTGNAPCRNHWKRLIREAFRLNYDRLDPNMQIVIRPRKGAQADGHEVARSLVHLGRRAAKKLSRRSS